MKKEQTKIMATIDEIVVILKKEPSLRNEHEIKLLTEWSFLIPEAESRIKGELTKSILKQRSIEQEESIESIEKKVDILVKLIKQSNYIVIYTGAGISTSASIPDYRGPNGLWTQIRKTGKFSITKIHDLSAAEPTLTHMAINELCKRKIIKHVVSQNCDGLHLRSGIQRNLLSEIHGNMYIEVCPTCEKQFFRQADVTERTCRFRHKTGRKCHSCKEPNNNLIDTIVLYGERSRTKWPMNWERAGKAAKKADLIICMGSSLKTLRRYNCLWPKKLTNNNNNSSSSTSSSLQTETKLAIINLQYTSKDKNAVLKINGKCDLVMQLVMQKLNLNIPSYDWRKDPLLELAVPFTDEERKELKRNLIFELKEREKVELIDDRNIELSESPSLFVSELTDDPEKKSLRMRIRAVNNNNNNNTRTISDNNIDTSYHNQDNCPSLNVKIEQDNKIRSDLLDSSKISKDNNDINDDAQVRTMELQTNSFVLPGWLGKSIGSSRPSSYRRKRHGNKGKKHSRVLKQQQQLPEEEEEDGELVADNDEMELSPSSSVMYDTSITNLKKETVTTTKTNNSTNIVTSPTNNNVIIETHC